MSLLQGQPLAGPGSGANLPGPSKPGRFGLLGLNLHHNSTAQPFSLDPETEARLVSEDLIFPCNPALVGRMTWDEDPNASKDRVEGYAKIILMPQLRQMMFVAGETSEPSVETTTLIEQIVHEQVYEMVHCLSP